MRISKPGQTLTVADKQPEKPATVECVRKAMGAILWGKKVIGWDSKRKADIEVMMLERDDLLAQLTEKGLSSFDAETAIQTYREANRLDMLPHMDGPTLYSPTLLFFEWAGEQAASGSPS